jgi:tetratricopeptide (TPR) repeat protein
MPIVGCVAYLAIVALTLWPALSGGFIFDDFPIFIENKVFHTNHWDWPTLQAIWDWSQANIHRPLAMLSYAFDYSVGGSARTFKTTNLAIHLFNTWLLMVLASRLLRTGLQPRNGDDAAAHGHRATIWAMSLATAWALHPLQVSTVMYVVQRMELLGFTFTMLALLSYWRARQLQLQGLHAWTWLVCTVACITVGYYCKETVVLVPGYTLLLELTLLHFCATCPKLQRSWRWFYAAGCLAAGALFVFYLLPHYSMGPNAFNGRAYTAWERELTQLRALSMYIGWIVLPLPSQMHFYYDNYLVSTSWLAPATTWAGALFLSCLLGLATAMRLRRPLLALGIAWFFMAHAITSAPLPLELVFEHRNYPALFGILLALTDLLWLATRHAHPRLPAILATIFLATLSFFTVLRAATWGNPLQLAMTLVHDNPTSPRASYDLARLYMDLSQDNPQSPLFARAMRELERGAALPNSSPLPEQALLLTAASEGVPAQAAWWESFLNKLRTHSLGPQEYRALQGLASQAVEGKADIDPQRLSDAYQIMLGRSPSNASLHAQYADVASQVMHNLPLAIHQLEVAIDINKNDPDYAHELIGYLLANGRLEEASALFKHAEQQRPNLQQDSDWMTLRAQLEARQQAGKS